jgi:hypothetical protein
MKTVQELATKKYDLDTYPEALFHGEREIGAYLRANGDYAVRLYLPAGELLPFEKHYAYVGPSIEAARDAWRETIRKWDEMYR